MNGAPRSARVVVKLGGSLAGDPSLAHWLRELALSPSARFVVVPGGGPFADAVRAAQNAWHFRDGTAHAMAIGAMDLFGRMLCGIETRSIPCSTPLQFEDAWSRSQLPVWLPGTMMMTGEPRLPHSWDVTSDTIAAWLAAVLGADGLLLVKSCEVPADDPDPALLAAAGIVDPALPGVVSSNSLAFHVVQRERWSELPRILTRFSCRV